MQAVMMMMMMNVMLYVHEQSLVEEKVRQLSSENASLQASLERERQLTAASQQQTRDLQLVSQQHTALLVRALS